MTEETNRSLFIIGNGFDLAHNLKTSYSDFILWYLKGCISSLNDNNNDSKYSDPLVEITKHSNEILNNISSIDGFLNVYRSTRMKTLKENILFNKILEHANQNRWVDIENIYYKCLSEIAFKDSIEDREDLMSELNDCLDFLKDKLKEYLLFIYNMDIKTNINIELHIQKILSQTQFVKINNQQPTTYFLNFNYTPTINKYINTQNKKEYNIDVINIHGQINEPESLIFGYGDEMDINYEKIEHKNNNKYLKHFKSFGYFKNTRLSKLLSFIEVDTFDVYIMGHSCGISDRLLLNTIFQHDNCNIIKIFYHKIDENKNDFVEKTMEISRNFTLEGKAKMRKRIIPFDLCQPLTK